jgi:four helix bundle protein
VGARRYEDLVAWTKSRALVVQVYRLSAGWPDSERFGLVSQARRAAVSVMSNVAEGSGRGTEADFHRFLRIAYGSLMELESQLYVSLDLGFTNENDHAAVFEACSEVGKILNGLMRSLKPTT